MMYITESNKVHEWRTGEKIEEFLDPAYVTSVQADCQELLWVINNISNIPCHKTNRVQFWYGDMAKLIASSIQNQP